MVFPDRAPAAIRVLVVDDELLARRNLTVLLRRDPDIGAIVECESGFDAVAEVRNSRPDLVFLDVQMPECDGFDVLEMLGGDLPSTVIFVTAYDEYALRAFDAGALDYLLKPFDDARFARALTRAKDKLAHYPAPQRQSVERLVVKNPGQMVILNAGDIDWIEAADYYACLHVGNDTHIMRRTLSDLERDLGEGQVHPYSPLDHREPRSDSGAGIAGRRGLRGGIGLQDPVAAEPALSKAASGSHGCDVGTRSAVTPRAVIFARISRCRAR